MPRLGLGLGLNLPRPIFLGGGSPSVPVGALATYTAYSPSNFTLVTGDSVNVWQDESVNSNDLTQGTSGNQPTLVEDNTVTQFTANNQPTFQKDKQVAQDTLANMPTYDQVGGVDVMAFGDSKFMESMPLMTGDFTYIFRNLTLSQLRNSILLNGVGYLQVVTNGQVNLRSDTPTSNQLFTSYPFTSYQTFDLAVVKEGNNARGYIDGVISPVGNVDVTGQTFTYPTLSRNSASNSIDGSLGSLEIYDVAVVDVVNPTETPDFELDASDPSTMLNDSDVQPVNGDSVRLWHDPSAVDAIATGYTNTGLMEFSSPIALTPNWAWRMVFKNRTELQFSQRTIQYSDDSSFLEITGTNGYLRVYDDLGTLITSLNMSVGEDAEIVVSLDGTDMTFYDGVTQQIIDVTGKTFTKKIKGLFSSNSGNKVRASFTDIEYFETAVADPTNIVEIPDFTLTPDPSKMRTSANANPVLSEGVAKWYADEWSGYRDNHVLFDPVKYMEGLPPQAGDFTYVFKYQDDDQATAGAIVSSNIDASGIFNVDGDTTDLRAGDATNYLFDNTGATSYRMVAYLKSGNDVYNVTDYVTAPTQDATSKAFNLTSLSKATSGKDMKIKEFYLYDRELTGTDLDYFFYLRDANTGEILLPPLLPS